jgi:hypothetical protein
MAVMHGYMASRARHAHQCAVGKGMNGSLVISDACEWSGGQQDNDDGDAPHNTHVYAS